VKPEDLNLQSDFLLSRYPPELFAYTRLGIPPSRFATRTGGAEWEVGILDVEGEYRVVNLSRIGICLAGTLSLKIDNRYKLWLRGPAGESVVDFYVLRCHLEPEAAGGSPGYRMAGLFTELLNRRDLPD
jgi:hypothetical protein